LVLCTLVPTQAQQRELKDSGHLLGETAEQFYSEGFMGDVLRACQARDWKSVSQLSKAADHSTKTSAKDICSIATLAKEQATSGARLQSKGCGDKATMKSDTFTLDGGRLVKIEMVYRVAIADIEGIHPKAFSDLYAGLQEAYGSPTTTVAETMVDVYGIKHDAHRAVWMGTMDVITIVERPGADGRTDIVAETLVEHNRAAHAPKAANPLQ
jgi:hypothetical protein